MENVSSEQLKILVVDDDVRLRNLLQRQVDFAQLRKHSPFKLFVGATQVNTGKLRLFTNATSLGGCESLIEHRASVEGANPRSPQNLLRMSVGLEDGDDLVADLAQALG